MASCSRWSGFPGSTQFSARGSATKRALWKVVMVSLCATPGAIGIAASLALTRLLGQRTVREQRHERATLSVLVGQIEIRRAKSVKRAGPTNIAELIRKIRSELAGHIPFGGSRAHDQGSRQNQTTENHPLHFKQ